MAIIQIRQAPNANDNLSGKPPMLRQPAVAKDNLTGRPAMLRQPPNRRDNLLGKPPMLRQPTNPVDNLTGKPPMARQNLTGTASPPREGFQLPVPESNGMMMRYDGTGTSIPPVGGFQLPHTNSRGIQYRQEQPATQTILRDYRHAARIFTDSNFRLSPKYGFLFYVEFDFNPAITEISNQSAQELGMIVKSVSLPKFTIDTKVHNAYNRKNIVQNKINYDQVQITFHDDQSDNVRQFWYDYYSYFYRDPDYADATYQSPHKYQSRPSFDWGYTPRPAVGYNSSSGVQPYQYIQAIRIYSLYQGNFSEYELVNPIITSFKHGDHANGENNLLEHQMSVQFETVKYQTGYVTENTVGGFIDLHYDRTLSPNGTQIGEAGPRTRTDTITDLANNQTAINPSLRTDSSLQAITLSPSGGFSAGLTLAIGGSAASGFNAGGYSIPSLGSLRQGIPSGAAIKQQLEATAIGIAGRTASSLANGVVGSIAKGLGPNGGALIGLAAAAISNPQGALRTAENMAIGYGTRMVSSYVNNAVNSAVNSISGEVSNFVSENISQPLSQAWGDVQNSFGEFTASFSFGGTDSADTAALFSDSSSYDAGAGWSS